MTTHHEKGEFDHLKEELRRLKRAGAPWYFESELHRRLHGGHSRRFRLAAFPLGRSYVITFVAIASLAAAGTMMMMRAGLFAPQRETQTGNVTAVPSDSATRASSEPPTVLGTEPSPRSTAGSRVPAPARSDVATPPPGRPADAIRPSEDPAGRAIALPEDESLHLPDSVQAQPPPLQRPTKADSAKPAGTAVKDSAAARLQSDSARKDTSKGAQQSLPVK